MSAVAANFDAIDHSGENDAENATADHTTGVHQIDAHITTLTSGDTSGGFDPLIHAVDKTTGLPKRRGDGSYALKRGRKAGGTPSSQPGPALSAGQSPSTAPTSPAPSAPVTISNEEAARQMCNLAIGAAVAAFGDEWEPTSKDEGKFLVTSVKNYFDARGQVQLSPEWGLAFAVVAYSLPRLRHENTRTKIVRAVQRVKGLVSGLKTMFKRD